MPQLTLILYDCVVVAKQNDDMTWSIYRQNTETGEYVETKWSALQLVSVVAKLTMEGTGIKEVEHLFSTANEALSI